MPTVNELFDGEENEIQHAKLLLFKQLCRGLYFKYPELVHNYVSYYREMCDEESLDSKL